MNPPTVDRVYRWALIRLQLCVLAYRNGEVEWQVVEIVADTLQVQIQKLYLGGLLPLVHIPQA